MVDFDLNEVLHNVGTDSQYPMITVDQALELVLQHTPASLGTIAVDVADSINMVAAADVACQIDLPPFNAAIVDGFAVSELAVDDLVGKDLVVKSVSMAGTSNDSPQFSTVVDEAIYVTTGAPVPKGTTRVVPVEHCSKGSAPSTIQIPSLKFEGNNTWIRNAGSDVSAGQVRTMIVISTTVPPARIPG